MAKQLETIEYLKHCWSLLSKDTQHTIAGKQDPPVIQPISAQDTVIEPFDQQGSSKRSHSTRNRKKASDVQKKAIEPTDHQGASKSSRSTRKRRKVSRTPITLSESVSKNISCWMEDPAKFFRDPEDDDIGFGVSPLTFLYQTLLRVQYRRENDLYRSRFLKVLFFNLKEKLSVQRLHSQSLDTITRIISETDLVRQDQETIKKNVVQWSKEGKKLDNLCRELHEGYLTRHQYLGVIFCLPESVGKE